MLTFAISLLIMFAVVGGSVQWAARAERRRNLGRTAMAAIIDSAPSCVANVGGAKPADDSADFILQAAYENCAGFMTFGPGSTYGEEGAGAAGAYMVLVWIGIVVTIAVIAYWAYWENKRLTTWTAEKRGGPIPQ